MCLSNKKNTTASCTLYTANNLYFSYRYLTQTQQNWTIWTIQPVQTRVGI